MTTPSPFEVGRSVGNNVSGAFASARDKSAIDEILEQASKSGNPADVDNAMRQILTRVSPERQAVALQILQNKQNRIAESHKKFQEEKAPYVQGLDILNRQRALLKSGNLGPKIGILGTGRKAGSTFTAEGQRSRAEFERLGKALISLSSTIPIRNRQEFETLAADLYDSTKSQEDIQGSLDAMEQIIKGNLGNGSMGSSEIAGNSYSQRGNQQRARETDFVSVKDPSGVVRKIPRNLAESAVRAGGVLQK